jgi:hypothetical protein
MLMCWICTKALNISVFIWFCLFQVHVRYGVWASDVIKPQIYQGTKQGILLQVLHGPPVTKYIDFADNNKHTCETKVGMVGITKTHTLCVNICLLGLAHDSYGLTFYSQIDYHVHFPC